MGTARTFATVTGAAALILPMLFSTGFVSRAAAQNEQRLFANPPPLEVHKGVLPKSTLLAEPAAPRMTDKKTLDLTIAYTESHIYNPATGREDKVRLRSYVGTRVNPDAPYVAPTIEVDPGDTVRITLHNKLPPAATLKAPNTRGQDRNRRPPRGRAAPARRGRGRGCAAPPRPTGGRGRASRAGSRGGSSARWHGRDRPPAARAARGYAARRRARPRCPGAAPGRRAA